MLVTALVFVIILGLLIFVHELGHFLMAKRAGIKVEEFAFGFPPRLFSIKRGETEYTLNLLPIGGYVKMLGEEEDAAAKEKNSSRSYAFQSVLTRAGVVVAGVVMNLILAWLLLTIGFIASMAPIASDPQRIPLAKITENVAIAAVGKDTPADKMGLKPGDHVLQFNNEPISSSPQLANLTQVNKGKEIKIEVSRAGETQVLAGQLGAEDAPLGVRLGEDVRVKLPFWWAPIYAIWETIQATGLIFVGIIQFFSQLLSQLRVPEGAAGPVGVFYYTQTVLQFGFIPLLSFVAMFSINLAVINILPIPALDGGRLLFIILEKLNHGQKVINQQIENVAHLVGFVLLIGLMLAITYSDILRLGN